MRVGELIKILKKADSTKPVMILTNNEKSELDNYYDNPNEFLLTTLLGF